MFLFDFVIIFPTIYLTNSWGEWVTGTVLYFPSTILAALFMNMVGIGGETGIFLLWSPLVLLIVRAKIEVTKSSSSTQREFKKATFVHVLLWTFIIIMSMILFSQLFFLL